MWLLYYQPALYIKLNKYIYIYIYIYIYCQGSVVCHLFLPLVSIFDLFPVLVSCRYELICVQLCVCDYVLITLCILVLSFEFDFVWSTRYFPVCPVLPCPALSCLVLPWCLIKDYYLSLCPRLRVPVPPSCVHRDIYIYIYIYIYAKWTKVSLTCSKPDIVSSCYLIFWVIIFNILGHYLSIIT